MTTSHNDLRRPKVSQDALAASLRARMMPPEPFWPSWSRLALGLLGVVAVNCVAITWLRGWGWPYQAPATSALLFTSMLFWGRCRPLTGLIVGTATGFGVVAFVSPGELLASVPLMILAVVGGVGAWSYGCHTWWRENNSTGSFDHGEGGGE